MNIRRLFHRIFFPISPAVEQPYGVKRASEMAVKTEIWRRIKIKENKKARR